MSGLTGATVLSLLTALPVPSPAAAELVAVHAPFASTSALPSAPLNKWLTRLNSAVTAREAAACALAETVITQDVEGYVAATHGKAWMAACLGSLGGTTLPIDAIPAFLSLTRALVASAPHAPAFEREVVNPAMGKLAVTMGKLVQRTLEARDWGVMHVVLDSTQAFISACPAPFRPAIPTLRPALTALVLRLPPHDAPEALRIAAAETLALLYLCGGKAAAAGAWGGEMRDALGGLGASISALAADAWEEEPPRTAPLPPPAALPTFPLDPVARALAALAAIEGYAEIALALLRLTTARPVPIPVAQIVSSALRLLNLTLDTPTAAHISPAHQAVHASAFPKLWRAGLLLLTAATAVGDHLVPHLSPILEHSVFLLENVPPTMREPRLLLLRFHGLFLESYPAATLPVEYTTRLLRFSLGVMGTLLDTKPAPTAPPAGRKSKKRARGAEDALIGTLEGRAARATSQAEADIVLTALNLTPKLHTAPLLSPALLTFSIRLHLSLHMTLRARPGMTSYSALAAALDHALEEATHLESSGTARDVCTLLIAILPATAARNAAFNVLLHPALPPAHRPLPPLAQLHMFAPESEEEKKLRREMGFIFPGEGGELDEDEDEDEEEEMVVDEAPAAVPLPAVAPLPVAPLPVLPPILASVVAQAAPPPAPLPVPAMPPIPVAVPTPAAPLALSAAAAAPPLATLDPAVPFMSVPSAVPVGTSAPAPAPLSATLAPAPEESDDEAIPELDSGSSDEDE